MTRASRGIAALAAALVAVGAAGCAPTAQDGPSVIVTTNILGDVVEQLVGDEAEVLTLMQAGADPHSFEISAQQAARLEQADLVVSNGLGLEEGVQQHLEAAVAAGATSFVAGDHVDAIEYAEGDSAGLPDPHLWTDPQRMLDVVDALGAELAAIDGVDQAAIEAGVAEYRDELVALDDDMTAAFSAIPEHDRDLVTNHHVFGYLAERFDFSVVGAVIPSGTTLAAPSASDLSDLVEAIEAADVPVVFAESSQPARLAEVLAEEAGIDIDVVELFTESLTEPGGGAETYLQMMRVNTERIAAALGS